MRSKTYFENENQNELIIPEWLFQERFENKNKKLYNPKLLKQVARDNIKLDDKQLYEEIARKMFKPYCFTDGALQVGLNNTPDSRHINHAKSKIIIKPNFHELGIEVPYINKILKVMAIIFARLYNQHKFNYQTVFSARFYEQKEDNQVLDEIELYIHLKIIQNQTESDIVNFAIKSSL